jgi:dihydroorotate dehydrogenase
MFYKSLLRPIFFRINPESAHDYAYTAARIAANSNAMCDIISKTYKRSYPNLQQEWFDLQFVNPVGLAAGFDKNGYLPRTFEALGFGFVEIGSITAQHSTGNRKPRMFRLPRDYALVNRMGLNNDGARVIADRILQNGKPDIPVGVNIAKTHSPRILNDAAIRDYMFSYREAAKIADYITVNISCPNTEEGKTFEDPVALQELLSAISTERVVSARNIPPLFVKFSSDLSDENLTQLIAICENKEIDGYVAVNTSSLRIGLTKTDESTLMSIGKGGLSGQPLLNRAENTIRRIRNLVPRNRLIIGVGGVDSFDSALRLLSSGASLLQVYTGLVYQGPGLASLINHRLSEWMDQRGMQSIRDLHQQLHLL